MNNVFLQILLSNNVISQDTSTSATTSEPESTATTDDSDFESTTTFYEPPLDVPDTMAGFCQGNRSYNLPLIELPRKAVFRFPVIFLGIELLVLLIIRGIIAIYVFRRRLRKIFIFTHPPILDERYFDDPPPYAVAGAPN